MHGASFFWGVGFLFDCSFPLVLKREHPDVMKGSSFLVARYPFQMFPVFSSLTETPFIGAWSDDCSGGT